MLCLSLNKRWGRLDKVDGELIFVGMRAEKYCLNRSRLFVKTSWVETRLYCLRVTSQSLQRVRISGYKMPVPVMQYSPMRVGNDEMLLTQLYL